MSRIKFSAPFGIRRMLVGARPVHISDTTEPSDAAYLRRDTNDSIRLPHWEHTGQRVRPQRFTERAGPKSLLLVAPYLRAFER